MATLRIGELARQAAVTIDTIRFYERQGILPEPPRRASGYREYPPETVAVIRFIKRAQELGFTLRETAELLELREVPRATCRDVLKRAQAKVAAIDAKIRDLQAMRDALLELMAECSGRGPVACCPIIESLAGGSGSLAKEHRVTAGTTVQVREGSGRGVRSAARVLSKGGE
jgi:Hg(II)-responsive transcriptional regulator